MLWPSVLAVAAALLIGVESSHLIAVVIGLATLLPLFSHVRHVGVRDALAEPSAVTIIVFFYLLWFPVRALVIAASGYRDLTLLPGVVSSGEMVAVLLLASVANTALVESYYVALGRRFAPQPKLTSAALPQQGVVTLATILACISVVSLAGVLVQFGGLSGAEAAFLHHSTLAAIQGKTSIAESGWGIFATPTVWCTAYVAANAGPPKWLRVAFTLVATLIIITALVYGSRLTALYGLVGVWVVLYYSGWRIPARLIIALVTLGILLSEPIVSGRTLDSAPRLSVLERYSRLTGYGVLDVSLALYQEPQETRAELMQPDRWLDLPAYFVPAVLWPGRPNLYARRFGLYVAQNLGNVNDKATGFASTYVMEGWLIGGWPATLIISILFGAFLGRARRRLVGSPGRPSPAAVLTYCFVVTLGWAYYEGGDIVSTIVGEGRIVIYLVGLMFITGVLGGRAGREMRRLSRASGASRHQSLGDGKSTE